MTNDNQFKAGQQVFVKSLGRFGIVLDINSSGLVRVESNGIKINCPADQLEIRSAPQRNPANQPKGIEITTAEKRSWESLRTLDLHGKNVAEALEVVGAHISRSVLENMDEIEIVHGIGSGAVRDAVHKLLSSTSAVKSFKIHQFNPGVTRVFL